MSFYGSTHRNINKRQKWLSPLYSPQCRTALKADVTFKNAEADLQLHWEGVDICGFLFNRHFVFLFGRVRGSSRIWSQTKSSRRHRAAEDLFLTQTAGMRLHPVLGGGGLAVINSRMLTDSWQSWVTTPLPSAVHVCVTGNPQQLIMLQLPQKTNMQMLLSHCVFKTWTNVDRR